MKLSSIVKFFFLRVINTDRSYITALLLFSFLVITRPAHAQDGSFKPSKSEAEMAWNLGNYEAAYRHYNGLLLLYSRDPLYKYFTGACLVRLERDPSRAVSLLGSAINSSYNVKTVPDDVWFYYGRALQMNGKFNDATEAFNRFLKAGGRHKGQDYEVQKYLDQCKAGLGAKEFTVEAGTGKELKEQVSVAKEAVNENNKEELAVEPALNTVNNPDHGVKQVTEVPEDYDSKLASAVKLQYKADSVNRVAQNIRRQIETAPADKKESLKQKAEALEKKASAMQSEADQVLLALNPEGYKEVPVTDSNNTDIEPVPSAKDAEKAITSLASEKESKAANGKPVFSAFEVRSVPAYSDKVPIPVGKGAPAGLVYRIQLAAFKNPVPPAHFKGLYPMYGKVKPENGVTYYYTGMFRTLVSAREALQKVRNAGFPDAFIAAMMDDNLVSMERAAVLEKDWNAKPLFYLEGQEPRKDNMKADTIPIGTLYFRAEVMRSKKPVKPEVTEKIELLAGRRGLDKIKGSQGETVYLVGNFITFESADEYVSLLVRNGYPSARVVAYVGSREIAVEAARELLKKLSDD